MSGWLVVNADDLGVSRGATLGIIKAHRDGIVTSASLAVTTPFYSHAVDSCVRTCPDLGIGLHFTLTSGKPVSDARLVPLLTDERGFFRWRFMPLLAAVSLTKNSALLDQVEIELDAQLGKLDADAIKPDHIDGERHVHLIPGIFGKVVSAARKRGIPFVRAGADAGIPPFQPVHLPALVLHGGFAKSWLLSRLSGKGRLLLGNGVASPDRMASYLYSGQTNLFLKRMLELPPAPGVTEMMVHPGIPEESAGVDLGNSELERYLVSEDRRKELNACVEARATPTAWKLTNFRRLAQEGDA